MQFRITFPAAHNPAEDWSFQGIPSTTGATPVTVSDITLYSGNTLVWGSAPPSASAPSAPSAPGSLTASSVTATGATLSWTASKPGGNPIAGYDVYTSAGTLAGTTTSTSYALTGLNATRTTPYGYFVQAVDSQGIASSASNIAQFITSPDTSLAAADVLPPSEPGTPSASSVTSTGATLTWGASVPGTGTLAGYRLYELAPTARLVATTTAAVVHAGRPDRGHRVRVRGRSGRRPEQDVAVRGAGHVLHGDTRRVPDPHCHLLPDAHLVTNPHRLPDATPTASPTPTASSLTRRAVLLGGLFTGQLVERGIPGAGDADQHRRTPISTWVLRWTFPGDQQISSLWSASYVQSGEQVTATAESYNATIAPAGSVTVGFTGTYNNSDASPASFAVNGTPCAT